MASDGKLTLRKAAELNSEPTYFTGKQCRRGHVSPRRTDSGTCVECHNARMRWSTQAMNSQPDARITALEIERDRLARRVEKLTRLLSRVSKLARSGVEE